MDGLSRVRLRVSGFVQGVNFRYYARQRAQSLGLSGWVRNCPDGTVEADVQGDEEGVQAFVSWARQGPSMAHVENVSLEREEPDETLTGFRIVY
jgi:acylphosphatase